MKTATKARTKTGFDPIESVLRDMRAGKPVIVGPITSNGTCHIPAGTASTD